MDADFKEVGAQARKLLSGLQSSTHKISSSNSSTDLLTIGSHSLEPKASSSTGMQPSETGSEKPTQTGLTQRPSEPLATLDPADVLKLFISFHGAYGQKWGANIRDEDTYQAAKRMWYHKLKFCTQQQLKLAYEHCITNLDWPPSLPEFHKLCKLYDPTRSETTPLPLSLQRPAANPETARHYLDKCKAILEAARQSS